MLDFSRLLCAEKDDRVVVTFKTNDDLSLSTFAVMYNGIKVFHLHPGTGAVVFVRLTKDEQDELEMVGVYLDGDGELGRY
jgi:hypothetical protein